VTRREPKRERMLQIPVVRLPHAAGLDLAAYQSAGAAGMDLLAAIDVRKPLRLEPGARVLVPTGLRLALPPGLEGQVRPRSGLALHHGVTVLNSPGTIDCDYRGEVKVLLINLGTAPYCIVRGTRIAQLVLQRCVRARLIETERITCTERGAGGFGSTGASSTRPRTGASRRRRP
jgi:dUTP pyrophosphatase